ncbi:outer membrane efflux protein [Bordetella ansorpii]|uniref:Outer membrane efflux protein n=1 Tax=Bordetella ansorpii TaxID=288768 RepID=A0A157S4P6_9BORD|nr:efflux transporter outer membrane subunit [Bordetella ansorpii]SAI65374.1 outer membrane efflux protein [Bordetella ansorpii]
MKFPFLPRLRRAAVCRARLAALATALLTTLPGCTAVGPDYHPPQVDLPARWTEPHGSFAVADRERLRTWWRAFGDPMLDRLVDQALANNQDLGIAQARLRQARAERVQIASSLQPAISAGAAADALRSSKALDWPPGIGQSRTWRAGFDASWELDVFGGTRRAVEAADAGIDALSDDLHALQVSLLAELAADYAELRTAQARLAIARDNIGNLREGERLAERALRGGLGTPAEVAQARAEREAAQAQPPVLEAAVARLSHAIGVLAGGFPGDWRAALAESAPVLPVAPALPLALPSEVIRQRPDLQADERRLAAATARIGVAQAARLPRFSIPLSLGTTASLLHDLFSGASLAWSAGVQAGQSLYDGGRARAGVAVEQAGAAAARLAYERDMRLALRDVEDALTTLNSERQRQASLMAAVADSQQALDRATRLYRGGLSAYLPVLIAQRSANQARDALALSRAGEVRGAIALYKALGAGWQDTPMARSAGASDPSGQPAVAQTPAAP